MMAIIKKFILLTFILFLSCNSNKLIISKSNERKSKEYLKYYLKARITKDTLLLKNNIYYIKIGIDSFCIGKFRKNRKINKWFYYVRKKNNFKCYMIKKHNKKNEKLIWIDGLYNETSF